MQLYYNPTDKKCKSIIGGITNKDKLVLTALAVSDILHKTVVDVNENGTEAAAVTAVMVALTSARPSQSKVMEVNRPFIYMIADMEAGRILFSGRVMNL